MDLIDRYLDVQLKGKDLEAFAEAMKNELEFRVEVEAQRSVRMGMQELAGKELRQRLDAYYARFLEDEPEETEDVVVLNDNDVIVLNDVEIDVEITDDDDVKPIATRSATERRLEPPAGSDSSHRPLWGSRTVWAAAASIVLVAGIAFWLYRDTLLKKPNGQELAMETSIRLPVAIRGGKGTDSVIPGDQTVTVVFKKDARFKNHYKFQNNLTLYSAALQKQRRQLHLEYDPVLDIYFLRAGKVHYSLNRGSEQIRPLPSPQTN